MKHSDETFMIIENKKGIVKVYVDDIVYVDSFSRKVFFYTEKGDFSEYGKLDHIEEGLNDSFYRCHKRCLVNLDKIRLLEDNKVLFENGMEIGMCKEKFQKLKQVYKGYMIRKETYRNHISIRWYYYNKNLL